MVNGDISVETYRRWLSGVSHSFQVPDADSYLSPVLPTTMGEVGIFGAFVAVSTLSPDDDPEIGPAHRWLFLDRTSMRVVGALDEPVASGFRQVSGFSITIGADISFDELVRANTEFSAAVDTLAGRFFASEAPDAVAVEQLRRSAVMAFAPQEWDAIRTAFGEFFAWVG